MTILLIFSCFTTPTQIALFDDISTGWSVVNHSIDILFLIDIMVNFNLATYNEDMDVVEDRVELAKNYLTGWFAIDLIAIIPFDLLTDSGGESNRLVRMARLGRIYRILKLVKLVRFFKLQKSNTSAFLESI